ncbi:protein SOB FIVE-LIKE 5-like [Impatiens glandulifera]|uniref:protein SOB FIVE-LIKE 5-like n=1 Tax=Impatiens glandulifera TaxID=253017 RepID=UPI001FB1694D|nr:protein SOB FIVE-LIKE 5-like [Impatiens glandulifera]
MSNCESGWTLYLDLGTYDQDHQEMSVSSTTHEKIKHKEDDHDQDQEEEEEDSSMVSDASSGPPHFQEDDIEDGICFRQSLSIDATLLELGNSSSVKRRKIQESNPSFLDDDASSPILRIFL